MSTRTGVRMAVFAVLLVSLLATLLGRTAYMQVAGADEAGSGPSGRVRTEILAAPRGDILDRGGVALASTRAVVQVEIDRQELLALDDGGAAVLADLARLLDIDAATLRNRLTPCNVDGAVPGVCWNGVQYRPIPVAGDVPPAVALHLMESAEDYPAVSTGTRLTREYPGPGGLRAAHLLGYTGAVSADELEQSAGALSSIDTVGRAGLEQAYDEWLRGTNGVQELTVDTAGQVTGTRSRTQPTQGLTLRTSIDADLQSVVEEQLGAAVQRARANGERALAADSAAAVVLDAKTGRVLAMASYPDYDPRIWVDGIAEGDYERLLKRNALTSAALQGGFAPGSTYKPFTVIAMQRAGFDLNGFYDCPSTYTAGGRTFTNFESEGYGTISLSRALEVSCNTVFYRAADQIWQRTGGQAAGPRTADPIAVVPAEFGLGEPTGIDLPGESGGTVSGRRAKQALWQERREAWCAAAEAGYPELRQTDPDLADQYTALDEENCREGNLWREGDALNAAIGQGLTAITPLQLAVAYRALADDGRIVRPTVGSALLDGDGAVVRRMRPEVVGKANVDPATLAFLRTAMVGVSTRGSASGVFAGFPLDRYPVASKTGSAQVSGGKPSTSWFASYAPADDPQYVVIMMVTQGGTGAGTSGPSVRGIYEHLFGLDAPADDASGGRAADR